MIAVRRAGDRFRTVQPGITTWHCFSSGAHYDRDNTGFGGLVAFDEHLVAPGSGFGAHAHRGVEIVSWILDGTLRHADESGRVELVTAGTVQFQAAGSGIRHSETNASATEPLRFLQMSSLADVDESWYVLGNPPMVTSAGEFSVHTKGSLHTTGLAHLFIARGRFETAVEQLREGDSIRSDEPLTIGGTGELLVWRLGEA